MGRSILASLLSSVALASPPPTSQYAATARWMVENLDWGYLSTASGRSQGVAVGDPFGNPYAFADVGGVPYFYAASLDATIVDVDAGNTRVSLALSEAEFTSNNTLTACDLSTQFGDPENPPCGRLTLSGEFVKLADGTDEQVAAKAALFAKHPSFNTEPHMFFVYKIDVDGIWILDGYGGIPPVTPAEYLAASAAPTLRAHRGHGSHGYHHQPHKQLQVSRSRPFAIQKVSTARWMVETLTWGALVTTSSRTEGSTVGDPFGNANSFASVDGNLYFWSSHMDASMIDIQVNSKVSFSLSEAALTGTANENSACVVGDMLGVGDPENPPCARLVFSGTFVELDTSTSEGASAQAALFARHPSFAYEEGWTDFFVAKIDIEGIWFIDIYGGADIMSPKSYLAWSAEADAMVV